MYEAALDRLVNEFALVEKLDVEAATEKLETVLGG
jgi:RNA polymerase-interacting CarD/CdnL/TRCF family regulator